MAATDGDETIAHDVKGDTFDSGTQPSNDLENTETEDRNQQQNFETHSETNVVLSETHDNHDLVPDSDDVVANAVSLPNAKERTAPMDELANSEILPGNGLANSGSVPDHEPMDSEAQKESQPMNYELQKESQPMNYESQKEIQPMNFESLESQPVNFESQASQPMNYEVQQDTEPMDSEVLPEVQPLHSEVHTHPQPVSETQPEIQPMETEAQPQSVGSEGLPENLPVSEIQVNNQQITSVAETENQIPIPEEHPEHINNEQTKSDAPSDYHLPETECLPNNQQPDSEVLPNNQHDNSDALHQNQHVDSVALHDNQLCNFESLPENHMVHSETLPDHQPINSDSLNSIHLEHPETMTHYELVHSEEMQNNQLVNVDTLQHGQLVTSQPPSDYGMTNVDPLPSYELVTAEPQPNEVSNPEVQPNKRRKKKSIVWEHFTIETVSAGCRRACCKQCKQSFAYSTGSKVAGTSHLKRHIAKGACPALLRNQDPNQISPYTPRSRGTGSDGPKRRYRSPNTPYLIFDQSYQDRCRSEIAKMIIMHDYPLHMVEHPGFTSFVHNLQPQFNMVTFNTVQGDCVAIYLEKKHTLMKLIEGISGRVCLTLDLWSSSQSVGYVFITGHFIDSDWKLQKRTLNVVMEPYPDSITALSHAVAACLSDWNLEGRLFSITTNQPLNEAVVENLRPLLSVKNTLILNGQLLLGNCVARTFSSVAKDVLGSARETIKKVRDSVKYVKTSESHEEKFVNLKEQLQVPSDRSLFIDDQTRWSSTYQMLIAAGELKEVFSCLDTSDPDYKGAPSLEDWKLVETICAYLKPLYDASNILITTTQPTPITFFQEVWKLQLDLSRSVMSENPFISNLTMTMQEKIDKYWRDCSLVLAIAVVMDPRFKMKLVEFSFSKLYGDDAPTYVKVVDDGIHELFHEYVSLPLPLTPAYTDEGGAGGNGKMEDSSGGLLSDNGLTDFDVYIMETTSQHMKSELDQYLDESLLPRVPDFDVLGWWKLNKMKYPTLSKMARDILSVPVSCATRESVFETKVKEMDAYRSSLRPETVEALVCAKDWMQNESAEASSLPLKIEF